MKGSIKNLKKIASSDFERRKIEEIKKLREEVKVAMGSTIVLGGISSSLLVGIRRLRAMGADSFFMRDFYDSLGFIVILGGSFLMGLCATVGAESASESHEKTNELLREHNDAVKALRRTI